MRAYACNKLTTLFKEYGFDIHGSHKNIPKNIEVSIFNYCIKRAKENMSGTSWGSKSFREMYKGKFLSVQYTLNKYEHIRDLIKHKKIKSFEISNMFPWEIDPIKWTQWFEMRAKKDFYRQQAGCGEGEEKEGIMACPKCKSKKTDYYQLQTRSADESITSFFTCMDCGKRWKV